MAGKLKVSPVIAILINLLIVSSCTGSQRVTGQEIQATATTRKIIEPTPVDTVGAIEGVDPTKPSANSETPALAPADTPTADLISTPTPFADPASSGAIVVDHRSLELFSQIPEEYLQAAADLRMIYIDRSVGDNINQGLDCLEYNSITNSPIGCTRDGHPDPGFNVDPNDYAWSRQGGYPRSNWEFEFWPTPGCDEWYDKVDCFFEMIEPVSDQYDVVSFQLSYLAVNQGANIADQPGGFFSDHPDRSDVFDLEAFETRHPDQKVIYWTTSLARMIGTEESESFNQQMREYAISNGKILFDVADILSHDPQGNPCYDNRDGVPYDDGQKSENHPDDGLEIPAICPHYTTETNGGHLGSIVAGKILVAQAFWVLMAQIAGWTP